MQAVVESRFLVQQAFPPPQIVRQYFGAQTGTGNLRLYCNKQVWPLAEFDIDIECNIRRAWRSVT